MADEKNVSLDTNGKGTIKRAFVSSEPTAKLGKRVIHFQLEIKLDESSLAIRDKFAFWHFDETPLHVTIKPVRQQMDLPLGNDSTVTLSGDGRSVTMRGNEFARAVNELTGEIEEDEGDDE